MNVYRETRVSGLGALGLAPAPPVSSSCCAFDCWLRVFSSCLPDVSPIAVPANSRLTSAAVACARDSFPLGSCHWRKKSGVAPEERRDHADAHRALGPELVRPQVARERRPQLRHRPQQRDGLALRLEELGVKPLEREVGLAAAAQAALVVLRARVVVPVAAHPQPRARRARPAHARAHRRPHVVPRAPAGRPLRHPPRSGARAPPSATRGSSRCPRALRSRQTRPRCPEASRRTYRSSSSDSPSVSPSSPPLAPCWRATSSASSSPPKSAAPSSKSLTPDSDMPARERVGAASTRGVGRAGVSGRGSSGEAAPLECHSSGGQPSLVEALVSCQISQVHARGAARSRPMPPWGSTGRRLEMFLGRSPPRWERPRNVQLLPLTREKDRFCSQKTWNGER